MRCTAAVSVEKQYAKSAPVLYSWGRPCIIVYLTGVNANAQTTSIGLISHMIKTM